MFLEIFNPNEYVLATSLEKWKINYPRLYSQTSFCCNHEILKIHLSPRQFFFRKQSKAWFSDPRPAKLFRSLDFPTKKFNSSWIAKSGLWSSLTEKNFAASTLHSLCQECIGKFPGQHCIKKTNIARNTLIYLIL